MHDQWKNFLIRQGAQFTDDCISAFTTQAAPSGSAFFCPLTEHGLIRVEGADAASFLQGQLTCDIKSLAPGTSNMAAYCNPKGNVISLFCVHHDLDEFVMMMDVSLVELTLKSLAKYAVFSKVTLTNLSEQWVGIGIWGEQSEALVNGLTLDDHARLITSAPGRYALWSPIAEAEAYWLQLSSQAQAKPTYEWTLAEIREGFPVLTQGLTETFIPQMLNLQALNGVSFRKGCYMGQEVVARLQHRGKLNRHLIRAQCESDALPAPGDALHSRERQNTGRILAAIKRPNSNHIDIQAVAAKEKIDDRDLYLDPEANTPLTLIDLPYKLDPELFQR